jgi:predicted ester cyclase
VHKENPNFDRSAGVTFVGEQAHRNWERLLEHTAAEWSGDVDATMATMTRNEPFQIFHPSGLHVVGYDAVRAFYAERLRTYSGQGFFAKQWIVTDTVAVGRGWASCSPFGSYFGFETHGKTLCFPMSIWIYFEDGLVKGESAYADGGEIERQIREGTTRHVDEDVW